MINTGIAPFTPREPTEIDMLWELFWAVNTYNQLPSPPDVSEVRVAWGEVDDVMERLTTWLYENSSTSDVEAVE